MDSIKDLKAKLFNIEKQNDDSLLKLAFFLSSPLEDESRQKIAIEVLNKIDQDKKPEAAYRLGLIYFSRDKNENNLKTAYRYFSKAFRNKFILSYYYIGLYLKNGTFLKQNKTKAIEYFTKTGYFIPYISYYQIGLIYFSDGMYKKAFAAFKTSGLQGNQYSFFKLYQFYMNGYLYKKNRSKAYKCLYIAKQLGLNGYEDNIKKIENLMSEKKLKKIKLSAQLLLVNIFKHVKNNQEISKILRML